MSAKAKVKKPQPWAKAGGVAELATPVRGVEETAVRRHHDVTQIALCADLDRPDHLVRDGIHFRDRSPGAVHQVCDLTAGREGNFHITSGVDPLPDLVRALSADSFIACVA